MRLRDSIENAQILFRSGLWGNQRRKFVYCLRIDYARGGLYTIAEASLFVVSAGFFAKRETGGDRFHELFTGCDAEMIST